MSETTASPQEGYAAHRLRQRQRIVAAAEELFTLSGIDRVSMLDIASSAKVRPSTLYQYFKHKEDIVWAITRELFQYLQDRIQRRIVDSATGLQKIAAVLEVLSEELEERPEKVRFMAEFDVLYARAMPAEALLTLERELGFDCFSELHGWVVDGIADGSMRRELEPDLTLHAVLNAAIGTQRRLASLGDKIAQEYRQPGGALFREAMRIVLLGLSSGTTAKPRRKHTSLRNGNSGESK